MSMAGHRQTVGNPVTECNIIPLHQGTTTRYNTIRGSQRVITGYIGLQALAEGNTSITDAYQSFHGLLMPQSRIQCSKWIRLRGVRCQDGCSSLIDPGFFLLACTPPHFLAATLRFDHDNQIPTTKGTGHCSLHTERSHR